MEPRRRLSTVVGQGLALSDAAKRHGPAAVAVRIASAALSLLPAAGAYPRGARLRTPRPNGHGRTVTLVRLTGHRGRAGSELLDLVRRGWRSARFSDVEQDEPGVRSRMSFVADAVRAAQPAERPQAHRHRTTDYPRPGRACRDELLGSGLRRLVTDQDVDSNVGSRLPDEPVRHHY